ncbi:MAG: FixH family protein [Saccharospirillaceae bacterium]|nr:FixH family protein [Pseudomonadales bacterium]NRB78238.1 FixH family protein [Saccharospirillaceae bacterium]
MTIQQNDQFNSGPAYKQPWFWLIMAPLMTTILVGTSMLVYSIFAYDGRTVDRYTKDGFNVTKSFEREQKAQSLQIKANATISDYGNGSLLTVDLMGVLENKPVILLLTIYSPASKIQDVKIELMLVDGMYQAIIEKQELSKRTMQIIDPTDKTWLIQTKQSWPLTGATLFTPYMSVY